MAKSVYSILYHCVSNVTGTAQADVAACQMGKIRELGIVSLCLLYLGFIKYLTSVDL